MTKMDKLRKESVLQIVPHVNLYLKSLTIVEIIGEGPISSIFFFNRGSLSFNS